MNTKLRYFFTILVLILGVTRVQAQSFTVPEGVMQFPITAGAVNYMSLPLENDPTFQGALTSASANSITVADPVPWTPGQLISATQPYFVKFLTGAEAGRIVLVTADSTANGSDTLTLDTTDHTTQTTPLVGNNPSSFDVQPNDTFEVFPGDTLVTLFGAGTAQNPLTFLVGNANVSQADLVAVSTTATAPALSYFFDTSKGYWRLYPSTANANNTVIYPHSSFAITRRTNNGDTTFSATGRVPDVALLVKTLSFATLYTSSQYPSDISLADLNFGPNWTIGSTLTSSITSSDNLNVWNASVNHFDTYYQVSDSTWRKYPDKTTDVSSFVIPAGSTICVTKRETVSGSTSYLQPALPYNLN